MSTTQSTSSTSSWTSRISNGAGRGAGARQDLPERERPSRGRVIGALLLVIGAALAVAVVVMQAGDKVEVITIGSTKPGWTPPAKGEVIERDDLISRPVSGVDDAYAAADVEQVVGKTAAVDLVPGQVLLPGMVTSEPFPGEGESLVGLSLDPARIPATGLQPGDMVDVIAVPEASGSGPAGTGDGSELEAPKTLSTGATVYAIDGDGTAGGQQLLTVIVKATDAARLAAYSTSNRVAVVEISSQEK